MITSQENNLNKYIRKVDKSQIPTCNIMSVNIAAINMECYWNVWIKILIS